MAGMSETITLLKRFAMLCMLCVCVTGTLCAGAMVDENTRQLALGERGAQVGLRGDRQTITFFKEADTPVDLTAFPSLEPLLRALRLAPAPFGALAAVGEGIAAAMAGE